MSKIKLTDTSTVVIVKMAEGNPGAIVALMEIMKEHDAIDPQAAMGGLGAIMMLDTWGIYDSDIYILFNDKCKRNVRQMLMLMRATQLGLFSYNKLKKMASDQERQVNLTDEELQELDDKVCGQLDGFQRAA